MRLHRAYQKFSVTLIKWTIMRNSYFYKHPSHLALVSRSLQEELGTQDILGASSGSDAGRILWLSEIGSKSCPRDTVCLCRRLSRLGWYPQPSDWIWLVTSGSGQGMVPSVCSDLIVGIERLWLKLMMHASALYKCFVSLGKHSNGQGPFFLFF